MMVSAHTGRYLHCDVDDDDEEEDEEDEEDQNDCDENCFYDRFIINHICSFERRC